MDEKTVTLRNKGAPMRKSRMVPAAMALVSMALAVTTTAQTAQARSPHQVGAADRHASVLVIPGNARVPMTRQVAIGAGKSLMVQFPTPLKDVLVADPSRMDAVVQSANQVFLIAKRPVQPMPFSLIRMVNKS
ncbi:MAG: hypothetical protein HC774_06965 [Sphingomonadales bacterium]|nr:hypothetical protein [Sphingomonadales bacterium]